MRFLRARVHAVAGGWTCRRRGAAAWRVGARPVAVPVGAVRRRGGLPRDARALAFEREPQPRELLLDEPSLDRGFDVERLTDLRVLADQLASAAGHRLLRRLRGLPQIDRAPALGRLVRDPGLEAQPRNVRELVDRLVT